MILELGHFLFLFIGIGSIPVKGEQDLQALHTADALEPFVDDTVKVQSLAVSQLTPGLIVILIGGDDDAVQIEYDGLKSVQLHLASG